MDESRKPYPFPFKSVEEIERGKLESERFLAEHEVSALQRELSVSYLNLSQQKALELEGKIEKARGRLNSAKFALDKFNQEQNNKKKKTSQDS